MENLEKWPLLASITSPADYKAMPEDKLPLLAREIRDYLVYRVSKNGGHLASNLGAVELTMAVHRVFDIPHDHVIFDVGHQSYVHKLLTGRAGQFDSLRATGGLSGFTKRSESECDAFGAGHSSTAISAAIGMASADRMQGKDSFTVAVVGDGALTGGLAYEGLNNADSALHMIVILNENEMSISPNTGRLAWHLARLRASRNYLKTKELSSGTLRNIPLLGPPIYRLLRRAKRRIKHVFYRENFFEHMGIRYLGPVDGNDLAGMIAILEHAKYLDSSILLHVKTKKGKGYAAAEADPNAYHSLRPASAPTPVTTFSAEMGKTLCRMAERDEKIVGITAAMSCGTGLESFRATYPERFFDVGIAEGHAVTFAAGLSAAESHPVVALYSTFLQRAIDNVLHDAALQNLPLMLCVDRAGLNAADGPTHHGVFDVAMLGGLPNVRIYTPVTYRGQARAMADAMRQGGVTVVRYPNGEEDPRLAAAFYGDGEDETLPIGVRTHTVGTGKPHITVITHGRIAAEALTAAEKMAECGITVRVLLPECIAPYEELACTLAPMLGEEPLVFYEEEVVAGGFGMNLAEALRRAGVMKGREFALLGTKDGFVCTQKDESIWQTAGIDAAALIATMQNLLKLKENDHADS